MLEIIISGCNAIHNINTWSRNVFISGRLFHPLCGNRSSHDIGIFFPYVVCHQCCPFQLPRKNIKENPNVMKHVYDRKPKPKYPSMKCFPVCKKDVGLSFLFIWTLKEHTQLNFWESGKIRSRNCRKQGSFGSVIPPSPRWSLWLWV